MSPPLTVCHLEKVHRCGQVSFCPFPSVSETPNGHLPVLCNQAMEEHSHLHFGKVCSDTKPHATTKGHEMLRCTTGFYSLYATIFILFLIQLENLEETLGSLKCNPRSIY